MSRMEHSSFDHSFDIRHFPFISPQKFPPQHFPRAIPHLRDRSNQPNNHPSWMAMGMVRPR